MSVITIDEFDLWQPGYGLAIVSVYQAGTTTLASIFTDEALTAAADNPQTLTERIVDGISYGKFSVPLYIGGPYTLSIDGVDETGVVRPPLTTLVDQDASEALVTVTGGTEAVALDVHLARRIDVRDFGDFIAVGGVGASAATTQATLVAAIGVASAAGGGFVELPAGTYAHTGGGTVPQGVVLRGSGRGATTLQSTLAGNVWIIGGSRAGFSRLTLDGVSLVSLSVGIYAANKDEIVLDDVEIKRFDTGIDRRGGTRSAWTEPYISNCNTGAKLYGDIAIASGGALEFNHWTGGKVELCGTAGIDLRYVDRDCDYNYFSGITFDTNTGTAFKIVGARQTFLPECRFTGNTVNISAEDATPSTVDNTIAGLSISGGAINGGTIVLDGTLTDVVFRRTQLTDVAVTLTTPLHNILVEDSSESGVTVAGTPTAWVRNRINNRGSSFVVTADATATKAWGYQLISGQHFYVEAKVNARQRNGGNSNHYHIATSGQRNASSLAYDTQTANFTLGSTITGATSGATARVTVDTDAGATGTLGLQDVVGVFLDNEIITDPEGGSATVNGSITEGTVALHGAVTSLRTAYEEDSAWDATFVANGPEIELQVTGAAAKTVEWTADVDMSVTEVSTQ